MRIMVVGGAGYIGSHMTKVLLRAGHEVVVVDNLVTGHRDAVIGGRFLQQDIGDGASLALLFRQFRFDGVMHFAAYSQVAESVREPAKYYRNNVGNTQVLLDAMVSAGVQNFVFSSTAAIFGEPRYTPIDEQHPRLPINPYGKSKLCVEEMLADYEKAYGLKSVCLRYFNAAGADPEGQLGERHEPETHLIPLVLQAACGFREHVAIFGTDYATKDGTCVRDYVHVTDLCQAHLLALDYLVEGGITTAFNLGNGNGFSVLEVIETAARVTRKSIQVREQPRREGDPAILIADAGLAMRDLGWVPLYADLDSIVRHAWQWRQG